MKFRTLFNQWIPALRKSEKDILLAVANALNPEASKLLLKQIEAVNYVQRHSGGKEVNLYCMQKNKAKFDDQILFPNRFDELKLGYVEINQGHAGLNYATVWACNGHVFSIESPKPLATEKDSKITNITILSDPTSEEIVQWEETKIESWISDRLRGEVFARPPIYNSLNELKNKRALRHMPPDYIAIIEKYDGVISGSLTILGSDNLRIIYIQDAEYTAFAELPNKGVLAVKKGEESVGVWFIDFEDNSPKRVGESFADALDTISAT